MVLCGYLQGNDYTFKNWNNNKVLGTSGNHHRDKLHAGQSKLLIASRLETLKRQANAANLQAIMI